MTKVLVPLLTTSLAVIATSFALSLASLLQTDWVNFQTPGHSPVKLTTDYGLFRRCDSSSWTGDSTNCRKFPSRSQDCSGTATGRMTGDQSTEVKMWERVFRGSPVTTMEMRAGLAGSEGENESWGVEVQEKRRRLGRKDEEDDVWGFCDSWVTAGYAQQLALVFAAAAFICTLAVLLGGRTKRENGWRIVAGLTGVHAALLIVSTSLIAHEYATDDRFYYGSRLGQSYIMSTTAWALDVVICGALVVTGLTGMMKHDDQYEPIQD